MSLGLLAVMSGVTCVDTSTAPGRFPAIVAINPTYGNDIAPVVGVLSHLAVQLDNVHIVLLHDDGTLLKDTVISVPADKDEVKLELEVVLTKNSELLNASIEIRSGTTVIFSGTQNILVVASGSGKTGGGGGDSVKVTYSGPGATVTRIDLSPEDTVVRSVDSLVYKAEGKDAQNQTISTLLVDWSVKDPAVGSINTAGVFKPAGVDVRGTTYVIATLPTGLKDSTRISVLPFPRKVVIVSGRTQTGTVGAALGAAVVAEARGQDNLPVPGAPITFGVLSGGGSVTPNIAAADANGRASATFTLGPVAGPNLLLAASTVAGIQPDTATATGVAAVAAKVLFVQKPPATIGAGVVMAPAVTVRIVDANNNTLTTSSASVLVSSGAGSTLGGTTTVNAVNGIATFSNLTLNGAAGTYQFKTFSPSLAADSTPVALVAGPAFAMTALNSTAITDSIDATLAGLNVPSVVVKDVSDNPVAGAKVIFRALNGGQVDGKTVDTVTTDATGKAAAISRKLPATVGFDTVLATLPGLADTVRFKATVTPGLPNHLAFSQQPTNGMPGADVALTVSVLDRLNNVMGPGAQPSVTVALKPGTGNANAVLSAGTNTTLTMTTSGGSAAFNVRVDLLGTGYQLNATASGLVSATSNTFDIVSTAGAAASLFAVSSIVRIDSTDGLIQAGDTLLPAVVVRDANSVVVPGVQVKFKKFVQLNASLNGQPTSVDSVFVTTDANGRAKLTSWRMRTGWAVLDSLRATVVGVPDTARFLVSVFAGKPTHMEFASQPTNGSAGILFGVAVLLKDRLDSIAINPYTNHDSATISIKSGTGPAGAVLAPYSPTTSLKIDASGGAATWFLTLDQQGTAYQLQVDVPGLPSLVSSAFDMGPAIPPTLSAVNTTSVTDSIEATVAGPLVVLRDALLQPVAGVNVNFVLRGGNGSNLNGMVGPSILTQTDASGEAGLANRKLMSLVGFDTVLAIATVAAGVNDTVVFVADVKNGNVTQLVFQQQPSNNVANEDFGVNVQLRDRNANPATNHWNGDPIITYSIDGTAGPCLNLGPPGQLTPSYGIGTTNVPVTLHITGAGLACRLKATSDIGGLSVQSNAFDITPDSPSQLLKISGDDQSSLKSTALTDSIVVVLKDAYGNPIPGHTLSRTVNGGGSASGSLSTDAAGRVAQRWTTGASGAQSLTLATGAVNGVFNAFIAETLVVVQQPTAVAEGVVYPVQPKIQLQDRQGHQVKVSGVGVAASYNILGFGCDCIFVLNGTTTLTTDANGEVTYTDLALASGNSSHITGVNYRLAFTQSGGSGIYPTKSDTLAVRAGPAAYMEWQVQPVNVQVDEQFMVQIVAKDANGYVADGFNQSVTVKFGTNLFGATLSGTQDTTAVDGIATFPALSIDKLGTFFTLDATSTDLPDALSIPFSVVAPIFFSSLAITPSTNEASAPGASTCGVTPANALYCWGGNGGSQINGLFPLNGDCLAISYPFNGEECPRPMLVSGPVTPTEIAVGSGFACAVQNTLKIICWGNGNGNPQRSFSPDPREISESSFFGITAGSDHACALDTSQQAYCWGYNGYGNLGIGNTATSEVPTLVIGERNWSKLSAGPYNTCGISSTAVYCWGDNSAFQLGDPTYEAASDSVPHLVAIGGIEAPVDISTGAVHACLIDNSQNAWCWGDNSYGAIGDGSTSQAKSPVAVSGGVKFSAISAGYYHTCGIDIEGNAYCWGNNDYGQLGTGESGLGTEKSAPEPVRGGLKWSRIYAGMHYTCGISFDEDAYCWGNNDLGELGIGHPGYEVSQWTEPHKVALPGVASPPCDCAIKAPTSGTTTTTSRVGPRPGVIAPRRISPIRKP